MLCRISTLFLFTLLVLRQGTSQPLHFDVRKDDSHVGFSIFKWGIIKEEGRFRDFSGSILYDPENPSHLEVEFTVQTRSIDSRNESRDRALRSEDFFHVSRYPTMTFKSRRAWASAATRLMIEGDLTIKGVTKTITVPVKLLGLTNTGNELGTLIGFEADFSINRDDFNVGEGWSIIGREATIHLLVGAGAKTIVSR
ncbi:MAG: polyisoprenoid-binding protein [Bacteroidia bacterium]|nr:MAG: polyisoprenoid-binding protein [Bacteroidia bacterium]